MFKTKPRRSDSPKTIGLSNSCWWGSLVRKGTASVELALTVPLLLLLTIGSMGSANLIQQKQVLTVASYEAGLVASAIGGTSTDATQKATDILNAYGIKGATITITPTVTSSTATGTPITITISSPTTATAFASGWIAVPTSLKASTYMIRL